MVTTFASACRLDTIAQFIYASMIKRFFSLSLLINAIFANFLFFLLSHFIATFSSWTFACFFFVPFLSPHVTLGDSTSRPCSPEGEGADSSANGYVRAGLSGCHTSSHIWQEWSSSSVAVGFSSWGLCFAIVGSQTSLSTPSGVRQTVPQVFDGQALPRKPLLPYRDIPLQVLLWPNQFAITAVVWRLQTTTIFVQAKLP